MEEKIERLDALELHNLYLELQMATQVYSRCSDAYQAKLKQVGEQYKLAPEKDSIDLKTGKINRGLALAPGKKEVRK